jgi:hypothetical protein
MTACPKPVAFAAFVAYWSGDLDVVESDALEAHVFGCATCTSMSERIAAITEKVRSLEPVVISAARLDELRAAGRVIDDNFVAPGQRNHVVFAAQEMIVHHLGGLDLAGVDRVSVVVRNADGNEWIAEYSSVPYVSSGEVLIACQRHFAVFPPDIAFEVTTHAAGEKRRTTRYAVEHEWALV